ncbi:conjugative transposon protein TraM [Pedobacter steynii]|uniref:Conjugative transposon protein TraM n=1 Tax=Pedobacter steynii TaxID=430522 RepID=A0A1D7QN42_9SPHI|nr:conjugative transposon protein TraM [Pedobacter steynii]AOM80074.1 conjugative transposon protein TraM [Pedobacter steynii]
MKPHTEQILKKRKFLLMLPLLTVPFITLAFWAMGGGTVTKQETGKQQTGLNKELPGAQLSTDPVDKMSLYNKAAKDSLALRERSKGDPYAVPDSSLQTITSDAYAESGYNNPATGYSGMRTYADPNETKVKDRLAALERALSQPQPQTSSAAYGNGAYGQNPGMSADLDRLEAMMQSMTSGSGGDPDLAALNGMLEKITEIQNPQLAQENLKERSRKNKGQVYSVNTLTEQREMPVISRNDQVITAENHAGNSFYAIEGQAATDSVQTAIPAVVHETQTLVSGSTVKMRLLEDIFINGMLIPKGNFVFGTATINGERLAIDISGVRYGKSLFPVSLSVYDLDALEGIHVPGAITRDAVKDGSDRAMQSLQFMNMDPTLVGQAAGVGVEAAKGLFSKKAKLVRVTVKAGYPILLMDAKAKQDLTN